MKRFRWQIVILVVAVAAIAVLLLSQQSGSTQLIVPQAAPGGVYVEALVGTPSRFNPLLDHYNQIDRDVDRLIFSRLLTFDSYGNPVPDLAESWGVNVKGTVFNVILRQDARWHDGEDVTAEDVLFTVEQMRNPDIPLPADVIALWQSVEVQAFDDYTLQFRLPESYSPFVDYLSFGILPQHLFANKSAAEIVNDPRNLAPVGSGPYQFEELVTENGEIVGLVLSAFEEYYRGDGEDGPFIDEITIRYYPTAQDAWEAYQREEVLGLGNIDADVLDAVLQENTLNMYTARLPEMSMTLLNLDRANKPFFQNADIRKALLMALNRNLMVDRIYGGQAMLANGPILPGNWAYYDEIDKYAYDPQEAEQILRAAGYVVPSSGGPARENENGIRLAFELVYPDTPEHAQLAQMMASDWEKIGVDVSLIAVDMAALVSDYLEPRQYDAALVEFSLLGTPDPDPYPFWHQSQAANGQNYSQWDDRRASEYLEQARITPNHDERIRLYRNFQVHFSREMPAIPLFFPMYSYVVSSQVQGVQLPPLYDPSDRFDQVFNWFLVSRPGIEDADIVTQSSDE